MCRAGSALILVVACFLAPRAAADDVAAYLERHGLTELLVVHLEQQLAAAETEAAQAIADRLASLYAQLLSTTDDPKRRADLEDRGRRLLAIVPAAAADELRLALLRGSYRKAESIAENHRLRLASEEEVAAASRTFEELLPQLAQLRNRLLERSEVAGRRLLRAGGEDAAALLREMEERRRVLSQCTFLYAWSLYYTAWLKDGSGGSEGMEQARVAEPLFAEVLDTETPNPHPREVTVDLRGAEHIARAILGMALCKSLTSSLGQAEDWLALLEHENTFAPLRDEAPAWRLAVQLKRGAFHDALDTWRESIQTRAEIPISWIRLAAVHALEAAADPNAQALAHEAVAALAARGELEQILLLAERYGVESLGPRNFALQYVKGVQAYQAVRDAHGQERPTADPALIAKYRQAIAALEAALAQQDSSAYPEAAASARWLIAWCQYFEGALLEARTSFLAATEHLAPEQAAESLWMAIACLDQLASTGADQPLEQELIELINRFLSEYPTNERAATLVVRRVAMAKNPSAELVAELLAVPPGSEAHESARTRAAHMLYELFRGAQGGERERLAGEFLGVAMPLVALEAERAKAGDQPAAARGVAHARMILDVALAVAINRLVAARQALAAVELIEEAQPQAAQAHRDEIAFRRVVERLASDDARGAEEAAEALWARNGVGQWARHATEALFAHAVETWRSDVAVQRRADRAVLDRIVSFGERLLAEHDDLAAAMRAETVVAQTAAVADALMHLWQRHGQGERGRQALALYDELLKVRPRDVEFLRAAALLATEFGPVERALQSWRVLLAGSSTGSDQWFEAKFRLIDLLATNDLARAREVMDQHKHLNPEYGPEPWRSRLRALDERIPRPGEADASEGERAS